MEANENDLPLDLSAADVKKLEELHESYKDFYLRGPREVLQRALDLAGTSITELVLTAGESGVPTQASLYRIRDGHSMMSLHQLYGVARALGIPTAALVPAVPQCTAKRVAESAARMAKDGAYDAHLESTHADLESAWRPSIRVSVLDVPHQKCFRKHDGEEAIVVLDGEIEVDFRLDSGGTFRTERLTPNGFAQFAGFVVHSVVSVSEQPARILRAHVRGGSAADRHILNERWQRPPDDDELTKRLVDRLNDQLEKLSARNVLGSAAFEKLNAVAKADGKGARSFTQADLISFAELLNCSPGALIDDMYLFTLPDLPEFDGTSTPDLRNPHWESLQDGTIRNIGLAPSSDGGTKVGFEGDWWRRTIRSSIAEIDYTDDEVAVERLVAHEGEELLYCLDGELEVFVWRSVAPQAKPRPKPGEKGPPPRIVPGSPDDVERVIVAAGEYLHFPSWIPHNVRASMPGSTARAVSMWVKSGVPASVTIDFEEAS